MRLHVRCFLSLFVASLLVLALMGCSAAGGSGGNAGGATGGGLEGSGLVSYTDPIQYDPVDPTSTTDTRIFEFTSSEVELVFYIETAQVMGQRGT